MNTHSGLMLTLMLVIAGCAATTAPPERPIVVEAAQEPFDVKPYQAPIDQPAAAKPAQTDNGKYRLSVASAQTTEEASRWVKRAESLGYRAEVEAVTLEGANWYRVVLPGYRVRDDVLAAIGFANSDFGIADAWRLPNEGSEMPVPAAPVVAPETAPVEPAAASEPEPPSETGDY